MKVLWSATARGHLRAIHDHIARDSPTYARRIVDRITGRSKQLATFPRSGQLVPEYAAEEIREVFERPYRIMYKVGQQVEILAVFHGSQQLPNSL